VPKFVTPVSDVCNTNVRPPPVGVLIVPVLSSDPAFTTTQSPTATVTLAVFGVVAEFHADDPELARVGATMLPAAAAGGIKGKGTAVPPYFDRNT
jgi:hypothetical protein